MISEVANYALLALVLIGVYSLFARLVGGLLSSLDRFSERLENSETRLLAKIEASESRALEAIQKTRHSVHSLHQAWLGAPESVPSPGHDSGDLDETGTGG